MKIISSLALTSVLILGCTRPTSSAPAISRIAKSLTASNRTVYALTSSGVLGYYPPGSRELTSVTGVSGHYTWTARSIKEFVVDSQGVVYALNTGGVLVSIASPGGKANVVTSNVTSVSYSSRSGLRVTYASPQLPILSSEFMAAIRSKPSIAKDIFEMYKGHFRNLLWPESKWLNDDAIALAFATVVAYQAAPYGNDTPGTKLFSLSSLFADAKLECASYTDLMQSLYFQVLKSPSAVWKVYWMGWNPPMPFGNHSQVIAVAPNGTAFLFDPTINLVAWITVDPMLVPTATHKVWLWNTRREPDMVSFTQQVVDSLNQNLYSASALTYVMDDSLFVPLGASAKSVAKVGLVGQIFYILGSANTAYGSWCPTMAGIKSFGYPDVVDANGKYCSCASGTCAVVH